MTRGKPKFAQIAGGKIFHEGIKPKNLQIIRTKSKKNILQMGKPKMTYITGGKALLTLLFIGHIVQPNFIFFLREFNLTS